MSENTQREVLIYAAIAGMILLHVGVFAALILLPRSTFDGWMPVIVGGVIGFFVGLIAAEHVRSD